MSTVLNRNPDLTMLIPHVKSGHFFGFALTLHVKREPFCTIFHRPPPPLQRISFLLDMYDALGDLLVNNKYAAYLMIGCLAMGVDYLEVHRLHKQCGAPVPKGPAGSGKTTVMHVLRKLLGEQKLHRKYDLPVC